ncbi:MAG: hypothetical protein MUP15_00415 [Dehalococcoidia bacterium]|nr:hypothetical protein [Dehalococcoidia bacterium]
MDYSVDSSGHLPSLWSLRRRVPISWVQLGVLFTALAVVLVAKKVDPDFWWHLRTGKLIVESGIPRHDPFSWTAAGKAWVTHEWLSEVIIYGVESTLGYVGNVLLFGATTCAALLLMYALGRRLGAGTKPLVLLALVAMLVLPRFVAVRPQEFTWLLFAVFVYVLQRHDEGDAMPLWVLPLLMALWVNLHLGFFYGLMVVGLWILVQVFRHARTEPSKLRAPLMVAGGCLLATLLNPNGPEILAYPAQYMQGTADRSLIVEWQRPDFTSPFNAPIVLTLVLLAVSLLSRRRPLLWLLSAASVALSLEAARNLPFAVLLLLPVAGSAAADHWRLASRERDSGMRFRTLPGVALVGGLAACLLVIAPSFGASLSGFRPSSDGYPAAGAAFVDSHYRGARLLNEYSWGGYLIDRLYPSTSVFIDGREEFYGETIFGDYIRIRTVDEGWEALLSQYGVEVGIVERESRLAKAMRSAGDWQEAFTGPVEAVFVRRFVREG